MTPNKVQLVQELKQIDHPMRFRFAKWACNQPTEDNDLAETIIFQMKLILILADMYTYLPPNEYGCVYASLNVPAIHLQKMPILAKKKSSFQMKLILILAGM